MTDEARNILKLGNYLFKSAAKTCVFGGQVNFKNKTKFLISSITFKTQLPLLNPMYTELGYAIKKT